MRTARCYTGLARVKASQCAVVSRVTRRTQLVRAQQVATQGPAKPLAPSIKVVGCGSCCVDYLASVAAYPTPDDKLRTDMLEVQGGGNCANALTAAARLGLSPVILSKIGGDGLGEGIISELQADGVDTSFIIRAAGHPSPFTYIIVDRSGGTRTCIHTPGAPLDPKEVPLSMTDQLLQGAALVYFDGRLTETAIEVAARARELGVPVLVEAERLRPHLAQLLPLADYVITSAHFPQDWTGEREVGDALVEVLARLPGAKFVATTLGSKGSVLLERPSQGGAATGSAVLVDLICSMSDQLDKQQQEQQGALPTLCRSSNGVDIRAPSSLQAPGYLSLAYKLGRDTQAAVDLSRAAAERAAALNADAGNAGGYAMSGGTDAARGEWGATPPQDCTVARVTVSTAAVMPQEAVQDTTGAGDAFIGAALYCLATGKAPADILRLGAVVAACKCTALGARAGLPHRSDLAPELL